MAENEQHHESCNPIIKDLRSRAKRVYDSAENDRDYLLASLGVFMANVYEEGGPITREQCERNRKQHWRKLYAVTGGIAAAVGTGISWLWRIFLIRSGD